MVVVNLIVSSVYFEFKVSCFDLVVFNFIIYVESFDNLGIYSDFCKVNGLVIIGMIVNWNGVEVWMEG